MSLFPKIGRRDFTATLDQPGLTLTVEQLTWQAIGGPATARIKATGDVYAVWEMVDRLRCPVDIYNEHGENIWWGYVESVDVKIGNLTIGVSLEKMANRVKCVYNAVNVSGTAGEPSETAWQEDSSSTAEFGDKETVVQLTTGTSESALQRAKTALGMWKYPLVTRKVGAAVKQVEAMIYCQGWWQTLDWVYYANNNGREYYEDSSSNTQNMGDATARTAIAQSFTLSSSTGWKIDNVRLKMKKVGSPTDSFYVNLCADSGGNPGTVLSNGYLSGTDISDNSEWHVFTLGTKYAMSLSTTYWLKMERTGAVSGTNYFNIAVNEALGYSGGSFKIYNGSSWVARSPDADMLFTVSGITDTGEQVETIITDTEQFFEGIDRDSDSGTTSNPWRDGDQTALACLRELLDVGTSNYRRLLAKVTSNRRVSVYEEPAPGSDYMLASDGKLYDYLGQPIIEHKYPVGVWARLKDVVPGSVDINMLINPERVFIEEVVYDVAKNLAMIRERDTNRLHDRF